MQRTLDTNVLVRAMVDDGSPQSSAAGAVLARGTVHIPLTVLVEAEWVLRSSFKLAPAEIAAHFVALLGLNHIIFEPRAVVLAAVRAFRDHGIDFADAAHLYGAGASTALVTYDESFRRRAKRLSDACAVISVDDDDRRFRE